MSRVVARRLEPEDLPYRVDWFNSPEIHSQMTIETPISLATTRQWFTRHQMNERRRDFTFLESPDESPGTPIAMGGLLDIDGVHGHAELYILVAPGRSGQGYGSRATRWLCNFGFVVLELHRVYLYTLHTNPGARKMYERIGFTHEGILREHVRHQGARVDRHVQSILRSEWERLSWRQDAPLSFEVAP